MAYRRNSGVAAPSARRDGRRDPSPGHFDRHDERNAARLQHRQGALRKPRGAARAGTVGTMNPPTAPIPTPSGLLVIDKQPGFTSMDVCAILRTRLRRAGAPKRIKV